MKKAIIHIGASKLQENSLKWAKESGLHVVATDIIANAPSKNIADEFYNISGTDIEGLLNLAKKVSKNFKLIGVYCNSDFALHAGAEINKRFGLRGCTPESVTLSIDKNLAKQMMLKANLPVPRGIIVNKSRIDIVNNEQLEYPLIVKPLNSSGSRGVQYVNNNIDLKNAINHSLKFSKKALVEEFIEGDGIDTIGIMNNGRLFPCGLASRFFSKLPFRFPTHGFINNLISRHDQEEAYKITETAANAVGIFDGPVKADLLFCKGKFTIIEVAPRFHGDVLTSKTLTYASDFNPIKELFSFLNTEKISKKSILDINHKIILWKALFPLINNIDWTSFKNDDVNRGKILDLYLDPRYEYKKVIHSDNTTLCGFMFLKFSDLIKLKEYLKNFDIKYRGILI